MEVDFLRFVLLDPKYRLRLSDGGGGDDNVVVVGMQCWKGYLFYATTQSINVIRCDEQLVTAQSPLRPFISKRFSGVKGLFVSNNNSLHFYCKNALYSITCEQFIRGLEGEVRVEFDKGDIKKVTDSLILTTKGQVFERVGFELVREEGAVDVCMDYILDAEAVWKVGKKIATIARQSSFQPCSLCVLHSDLFAVGFCDGSEYSLRLVSEKGSVDLGNLTNAFVDDANTQTSLLFSYSLQYFTNFGSIPELMVVSHPLSIRLALAGRITESSAWTVIDLSLDEFNAEMPLDADANDTFPLFLAIDKHNTFQYKIPDDRVEVLTFPPSPIVCVATTDNLLIPFQLVNAKNSEQMTSVEPLKDDFVTSTQSPDMTIPGFLVSSTSDLTSPSIGEKLEDKASVVKKVEEVESKDVTKAKSVEVESKDITESKVKVESKDIVKSKSVEQPKNLTNTTMANQPGTLADKDIKIANDLLSSSDSKDFSPKQNALVNAFVGMHKVHSRNLESIREAIEELKSLTSTLQSCSKVALSVESSFKMLEESEGSHRQVFEMIESLTRLKGRIEGFRVVAKNNQKICKAFSENRDQLESGLIKAKAYFDYVQSFSKLDMSDKADGGDGDEDGEETKRELGQVAHQHIQSCFDIVDSCLTERKVLQSSPPSHSTQHFDLKKFLGRRKVELRSPDLFVSQVADKANISAATVRKSAGVLAESAFELPSFASFNRVNSRLDTAKAIEGGPLPRTPEVDKTQPKKSSEVNNTSKAASKIELKVADKQVESFATNPSHPLPPPKAHLKPSDIKMEPSTTEKNNSFFSFGKNEPLKSSPALPNPPEASEGGGSKPDRLIGDSSAAIPSFSAFSFGPSASVEGGKSSNASSLFSFKPMEPKKSENTVPPIIMQASKIEESPIDSPLSTPSSRSTTTSSSLLGQPSFGQTTTFAPILPTAFTSNQATAPFGSSLAQPPSGFAAFSNQTQQTTFGSFSQSQPKDDSDKGQKSKLPSSFTQFRG